MPDGTRTCDYCGSLHPADVLDILYAYLEDDTYGFSTTDKGYKFYANRPGVQNASGGGIKFYSWHDDAEDYAGDITEAFKLAWAVLRRRWDERGIG